MFILRWFLFPFSLLYGLVTELRNFFYDRGLFPSLSFDVPTIAIGNLSVGGSGKTPMVKYLIKLLASGNKVAVLSRGYGRKTKGFRVVNLSDSPQEAGDEPLEIKLDFPNIPVCVCEDRVMGISELLTDFPDTEVILLDDAFQHRALKADLYILLSEYRKPYFRDHLMPVGRLREMKRQARRAHAVVFTKAVEDYSLIPPFQVKSAAPVFYSREIYPNIVQVSGKPAVFPGSAILISGLARPAYFEEYMSTKLHVIRHFKFPDHYPYRIGDIQQILKLAKEIQADIITTSKDWVKLRGVLNDQGLKIWVQKVACQFEDVSFDQFILTNLKSKRNGPG